MNILTGSKRLLLFGLLVLLIFFSIVSEITSMTASAQSSRTYGCTAGKPCVDICGDHVCAPGELAQMKAASQSTMNNTTASTTSGTPVTMNPSMGEIIAGKVSYMDQASDGTTVLVRTSHPTSGQPLTIAIAFKDANDNFIQHQNYAVTVSQDGQVVLSNPLGHTHTGTDSLITVPLSSSDPVDIAVTLNGVGLPTSDPSTWTGVKGEVLDFSNVTDVQTPTTTNMTSTTSNMTSTTNMTIITLPSNNTSVPEFGPLASIVLAIAVISVIVIAAKTRVISRI